MTDEYVAPEQQVPTAAEWDAWSPEAKDAYLKEHPGTVINDEQAQPQNSVTSAPVLDPQSLDPVEVVPAEPEHIKGTPQAGLQRIQAAINLLATHSAARVGGSLIGEAILYMEEAYLILSEHHKASV